MGRFVGQETRQGNVPGNEGCDHTKAAARNLASREAVQVGRSQECKGHRKTEEQRNQTNRRPMACDQHQSSEDGPSSQVDTQRVRKCSRMVVVSGQNVGTGNEHDRIREPEATVRRERSGTKRVASSELPHAGEQLTPH